MEMKFEGAKQMTPKENLPLSEDAAMEEAALLKAQITLSREHWNESAEAAYRDGRMHTADAHYHNAMRPPSANEYKEAVEAVQQIKELAVKETNTKYVLFEMARVFHNLVRAGVMPVLVVDTVLTQLTEQMADSNRHDWAGFVTREAVGVDKVITRALTDAEKALRLLENQARKETKKDIASMKESGTKQKE